MSVAPPRMEVEPRLWPGVVIVVLMWAAIILPPYLFDGLMSFLPKIFGPLVAALALFVWWVAASRVPRVDRIGLPLLTALVAAASVAYTDPNSRCFNAALYAVPAAVTAWVVWLVVTPALAWPARREGLNLLMLLCLGWMPLLRMEGVDGVFTPEYAWSWTLRPENRPMPERPKAAVAEVTAAAGDWPAFRGPDRDSVVKGVSVKVDWTAAPKEVWRIPVGKSWSSFAAVGGRLYTQEQLGDQEAVVCLDAATGKEVWAHRDKALFKEAMAGPGPRATPTFDGGKIYALGAKGLLNCLDAATGKLLWSRDVRADAGIKPFADDADTTKAKDDQKAKPGEPPIWGFSASPLVLHDIVSVFAGGPDGKSLMAYHTSSGEPAWAGGVGTHSYCSPHRAVLSNVEQILVLTEQGVEGCDPRTGKLLWAHEWPINVVRSVQPTVIGDSDILLGAGLGIGTRRIHVTKTGDEWKTEEVWTTTRFKPYYNDGVVLGDHLFGFDMEYLACLNLKDGKLAWKQRGYGAGQVLLLAEQKALLVLSETGEVVFVAADPAGHKVLGKFQAIHGKTWNHPVLVGTKLYVRNGDEAACYDIGK